MIFPSASTKSAVPVKRIEPLRGLMKILGFVTAKNSVFNRDSRGELGYVMGGEAST